MYVYKEKSQDVKLVHCTYQDLFKDRILLWRKFVICLRHGENPPMSAEIPIRSQKLGISPVMSCIKRAIGVLDVEFLFRSLISLCVRHCGYDYMVCCICMHAYIKSLEYVLCCVCACVCQCSVHVCVGGWVCCVCAYMLCICISLCVCCLLF